MLFISFTDFNVKSKNLMGVIKMYFDTYCNIEKS